VEALQVLMAQVRKLVVRSFIVIDLVGRIVNHNYDSGWLIPLLVAWVLDVLSGIVLEMRGFSRLSDTSSRCGLDVASNCKMRLCTLSAVNWEVWMWDMPRKL